MINLFAFLHRKRSYFFALSFIAVASVVLAGSPPLDPLEAVFVKFEKKVNDAFRGLDKDKKETPKNETLNLLLNPNNPDKDLTFALNSPELNAMEQEFMTAKAEVENASKSRELFAQSDDRLTSLAKYAARYLSQQKRLYSNFMRNAHRVPGEESNYQSSTYDNLNLVLQGNAGLALINMSADQKFKDSVGNDVETSLRYNVRHAKGVLNRYNFAEVFMTPQDKDKEELAAIQDTVNEKNYRKVIALLSTRSRLGNHWAIQRMSAEANLADPDLLSCGENFVSFKEPLSKTNPQTGEIISSETGYYASMKKEDDFDQFNKKIETGLHKVTLQTPLFSADEMKSVLNAYYDTLKKRADDKDGMTVAYKLDLESSNAQKRNDVESDGYIGKVYVSGLVERVEKLWETEAVRKDTSLKLSSYIGDNWHNLEEVADRFAWTAFTLRKEMMIAQVVAESSTIKNSVQPAPTENTDKQPASDQIAADQTVAPQAVLTADQQKDVSADAKLRDLTEGLKGSDDERYAILHQWSQQAVEAVLTTAKEVEWRNKLKAATLAYLKSKDSLDIDKGFKADRLDKTFSEAWKTTQNGVKAQYVKTSVKKLLDTARSCIVHTGIGIIIDTTSAHCKYVKDISEHDDEYRALTMEAGQESFAGYWPATAEITKPLRPLTPDQLSNYLYKKLEFWSTNEEMPELRERARKIMSSSTAMKGVKDFFASLQQVYAALTVSQKLNSSEFLIDDPKENKILAQALEVTVSQAFASYQEMLDTQPERKEVQASMGQNMSANDWQKLSTEIAGAIHGRDKNAKVVKLSDKSMQDFLKQIQDKASQPYSPLDLKRFGDQLKAIALKNMNAEEWTNFSAQVKDAMGRANADKFQKAFADAKAAQDKTKVAGNLSFTPTPSPTPEEYYSVDRDRAVAVDLYVDAMSMMGLTRTLLREIPVREKVEKYHAKFFIELERFMDGDLTDKELYSDDADTMGELIANRIAPSVLDQRILADVWVNVATSQHSILGLQSDIPVFGFEKGFWKGIKSLPTTLTTRPHTQIDKIPTLLEKIAATYNPNGEVDAARAKSLMVDTIHSATGYQTNLLLEACHSKPLDNDDVFWQRMFDTSRNFRQIVTQITPAYAKYDAELEKQYRPFSEKAEEWITKASDWFFKASMIVMLAMVTGGLGGILVGVSANLGVASLFSALGLDTLMGTSTFAILRAGSQGLMSFATFAVKLTFKSLVGQMAIAVFNIQIALIGYNGWYTLPKQLMSQLQVANSQIGIHTQVASSREHILQYADMIFGKRVNFGIQAAMQLLFVGRPMLRSVKKTLGNYTREVIGRQGTIAGSKVLKEGEQLAMNGEVVKEGHSTTVWKEGDSFTTTHEYPASRRLDNGKLVTVTYVETIQTEVKAGKVVTKTTILPKGFTVPKYVDLVKSDGLIGGTGKWISQTVKSFVKFRGIITLDGAVATFEQSNEIMGRQVMSFYKDTDELLGLASERAQAIDEQMARIDQAIILAKDPNKSTLDEISLWTKNNFSKIFSFSKAAEGGKLAGGVLEVGRSAPFADAVVTERATNFIGDLGTVAQETNGDAQAFAESLGKMWNPHANGDKEAWELLMTVYKKTELEPVKAYWQAMIDMHAELAKQGPVSLETMFSQFGPGDAARHKDMFDWLIKRDSKSQLGAFFKKRLSLSNPDIDIAKFKQIYRDYDGLNQEIAAIAKKDKGAAANIGSLPQDLYGVLGLPLNASAEQIKSAYKSLLKKYHEDVFHINDATEKKIALEKGLEVVKTSQKYYEEYLQNVGQGKDMTDYLLQVYSQDRTAAINNAKEILNDPTKKAIYDENMHNILSGLDLTGKELKLLELPGFKGMTDEEITMYHRYEREGKMVPIMFRGKPVYVDGGKEILIYKNALPTEAMLKDPKARYVPVTINGEPVMANGQPLLVDSKRIPLDGSVDSIQKLLKAVVTNDLDVLVVDLNAQGQPAFKFMKLGEIEDIKHKASSINLRECGIIQ